MRGPYERALAQYEQAKGFNSALPVFGIVDPLQVSVFIRSYLLFRMKVASPITVDLEPLKGKSKLSSVSLVVVRLKRVRAPYELFIPQPRVGYYPLPHIVGVGRLVGYSEKWQQTFTHARFVLEIFTSDAVETGQLQLSLPPY